MRCQRHFLENRSAFYTKGRDINTTRVAGPQIKRHAADRVKRLYKTYVVGDKTWVPMSYFPLGTLLS